MVVPLRIGDRSSCTASQIVGKTWINADHKPAELKICMLPAGDRAPGANLATAAPNPSPSPEHGQCQRFTKSGAEKLGRTMLRVLTGSRENSRTRPDRRCALPEKIVAIYKVDNYFSGSVSKETFSPDGHVIRGGCAIIAC